MPKMLQTQNKIQFLVILTAAAFLVMHPSPSFSDTYSLGGYLTAQVGGYTWNVNVSSDYLFALRKPPSISTPVMTGGGLVWSGEFIDGQFMFRQSLGFEAFLADRFSMTRFSFLNTFAYVPYRTETFMIWAGPQLNLFYIWGKDSKSSPFLYNDYMTTNVPLFRRRAYRLLPIGTGLGLGLDYDVYKNLRLSFEGGFHFSTSVYGQSREMGNGKASTTGYEGYVNVAVMYRFGEKAVYTQIEE